MRIAIFGAGAIGGHLAARLGAAGAQVSVVARGAQLAAIQAHGLRLQIQDKEISARVTARADAADLGPQDVVISTVKAHGLPGAVDGLRALLGPDTTVVYAINGIPWWYFHRHPGALAGRPLPRLDPGARLWNDIGVHRTLGCVVQSANQVVAPGVVRNGSATNAFTLGEPDGRPSARLDDVLAALRQGVPEARASTEIRTDIWRKLLLNLAHSPLACLTESSGRDVARDPALREIFTRLVEEGERVANALGVPVTADLPAILQRMGSIQHRCSMLQDQDAGRPLEIDGQLAVVSDIARLLDIPTPTLDLVLALLVRRARQAGLYAPLEDTTANTPA